MNIDVSFKGWYIIYHDLKLFVCENGYRISFKIWSLPKLFLLIFPWVQRNLQSQILLTISHENPTFRLKWMKIAHTLKK